MKLQDRLRNAWNLSPELGLEAADRIDVDEELMRECLDALEHSYPITKRRGAQQQLEAKLIQRLECK